MFDSYLQYRIVKIAYTFVMVMLFAVTSLGQNLWMDIDSLTSHALSISSSNHNQALLMADSALRLSVRDGYKKGEAEALRVKGLSLFYGVQYSDALTLFVESFNLFQVLGDSIGMGKAKNNIAIVYNYQGLHEKSLTIHRENLEFRKRFGDEEGVSTSLNNIAVVLRALGRTHEALSYYKQAIAMVEKTDDLHSISRYYNNIGLIHLEMNQPDSAIIFFRKGLKIRLEIKDKQGIKNSYHSMGQYYSQIGNLNQAKDYFEKAMQIAKEIGIVYEIESTAKELSKTYAELSQYQKAYETHLLYKQMSDSLKQTEAAQLITRMEMESSFEKERSFQRLIQEKRDSDNRLVITRQTQFRNILLLTILALSIISLLIYRGFHLKKRSNALLTRQKGEILLQKEEIIAQRDEIENQKLRLQELNVTKDRFFSILAHDLLSPINAMLGLSDIMNHKIQHCENQELNSHFIMLRQSIEQTYSLLENLLKWSQTQTGRLKFNPNPISLKQSISEIIDFNRLNLTEKNIQLSLTANSDIQVYADSNMLSTILRNLVSNAIKFTPDNGYIEIDYSETTDIPNLESANKPMILIKVKDSGIGISEENRAKLFTLEHNFSSIGTHNEKGTGLGLILCKEFVEINNGRIWVESKQDQGSTFFITLPKV